MNAPLQVGFDATSVQYGRGVSWYSANLLRELIKLSTLELTVFGFSRGGYKDLKDSLERLHAPSTLVFPYPATAMHIVWNHWRMLPVEWLLGKKDVVHTWDLQPPDSSAARVYTVHDLAMWRYPHTADPQVFDMHIQSIKHLKHQKARFIAVSESTKQDMIEFLDIAPERISVIYEAQPLENRFDRTAAQIRKDLLELSLSKPYFLFVGTTEPRKNLSRMIQAWRPFANEYEFVIVGSKGWDSIPNEKGLRKLGYLKGEVLASVMKAASLMMYVSLHEGFGLPILDAFYYGVPVVTANRSAMSEIGSTAVIQVNPEDSDAIRQGIEDALTQRSRLIRKGYLRLKRFSWEKAAVETSHVYTQAAEERSS